jgi:RNA polymerase sigma-70 factor (ECF subfamily)
MVDDKSVISRLRAGDEDAFRLVINHHLRPVGNYVRRMIWQQEEADDIIQETFVRLWHSIETYKPGNSGLSTWLHRIAHNLCIDSIRRNQKLAPEARIPEIEIAGPEAAYENAQAARRIQQALAMLSEHQRSAIVLVHYQGLPHREVAAILEISVEALESQLRRTRSKLKTLIEEEDP